MMLGFREMDVCEMYGDMILGLEDPDSRRSFLEGGIRCMYVYKNGWHEQMSTSKLCSSCNQAKMEIIELCLVPACIKGSVCMWYVD